MRNRTAILVDDGLATGSTMRAAIRAIRQQGAAQIVVAVPVGPPDTCVEIAREVDTLICPMQPAKFFAVGQWYGNFTPTTEGEVRKCLEAAARIQHAHARH